MNLEKINKVLLAIALVFLGLDIGATTIGINLLGIERELNPMAITIIQNTNIVFFLATGIAFTIGLLFVAYKIQDTFPKTSTFLLGFIATGHAIGYASWLVGTI